MQLEEILAFCKEHDVELFFRYGFSEHLVIGVRNESKCVKAALTVESFKNRLFVPDIREAFAEMAQSIQNEKGRNCT